MRLEGKNALITGCAQGLGEKMANALAREGCNIAGFDVRTDQLQAVVSRIEGMGRRALGLEVDVRDHQAVQDAVAGVYDQWGNLDILVNNAGKGQRQPFTEINAIVVER